MWNLRKIRKALGDKLIGKIHMRDHVCKAISHLPQEIIENVCSTVWFVSSSEDAWGLLSRDPKSKTDILFLSQTSCFRNLKIKLFILFCMKLVTLCWIIAIQSDMCRLNLKSNDKNQKRIFLLEGI